MDHAKSVCWLPSSHANVDLCDSLTEYAQRGNVTKMKIRAVQALTAAMDLGLHSKGVEDGHFAEADRRTWWMTVSFIK